MCLDIGHANLCQATRNQFLRYLDGLDPAVPIIHLHVHENFGDSDSHLTLFTGPAGVDDSGVRAFLERLRQRMPVPVFWLFGKTQSGKTSVVDFARHGKATERSRR